MDDINKKIKQTKDKKTEILKRMIYIDDNNKLK